MNNVSVNSENFKKGDKVVRGRDWSYSDQDRDSEYGIITTNNVDEGRENKWIRVRWENGEMYDYRIGGKTGIYDLYFYTGKLTSDLINRIGHELVEKS